MQFISNLMYIACMHQVITFWDQVSSCNIQIIVIYILSICFIQNKLIQEVKQAKHLVWCHNQQLAIFHGQSTLKSCITIMQQSKFYMVGFLHRVISIIACSTQTKSESSQTNSCKYVVNISPLYHHSDNYTNSKCCALGNFITG